MKADLNKWIAIWHPQYRRMLVQLLIIGFVVGGLVYLENTLLHGLVESLTGAETQDKGLAARLLSLASGDSGLPFAFLGAIFIAGIIRAVISARRDIVSSRMVIQSRDELEQQVLYHLLNREDEFFAEHSPREIMNRLEVDLYRILERRETLIDIFWCGLMILGNLIFFGLADWRLAIVVVVICVVGTLFTKRVSKPVQSADHKYFQSNDQVKM
ncbi:MAG: ABC transporter ATP-binding protein, partial [Deltaproteobacteria bacterium]|nr:ABC transporter ATP-binding protein [Deltaproteobacteria bacterium]